MFICGSYKLYKIFHFWPTLYVLMIKEYELNLVLYAQYILNRVLLNFVLYMHVVAVVAAAALGDLTISLLIPLLCHTALTHHY